MRNAFSELCSGNGFSCSFFCLFVFVVCLLKNSASRILYVEGSGAIATEQRWIEIDQEKSITLKSERIKEVSIFFLIQVFL